MIDLIKELRAFGANMFMLRAADEIERLQQECRECRMKCDRHIAEVSQLERNAELVYENHKRIVAELTAERDEARRSLCECRANGACDSRDGDWFADDGRHILAREYAAERGWDCFKEEQ
jgi:hypothetical protein